MKKEEVFEVVDSELEYQKNRMYNGTLVTKNDFEKSVSEWIIYMEVHLNKAKQMVYDLDKNKTLDEIRKVTALGVTCMMHNKTQKR